MRDAPLPGEYPAPYTSAQRVYPGYGVPYPGSSDPCTSIPGRNYVKEVRCNHTRARVECPDTGYITLYG